MRGRGTRRGRVVAIVENVPLARDHRLRKQVAALDALGIDVTVVTPADAGNSLVRSAHVLEYRPAPMLDPRLGFVIEYTYAWLASAWLVLRARMRGPIDVFHICGSPDIFFTITAPFQLLGAKMVFDQRDLWPEAYATRFSRQSGVVYRSLLLLERISYRRADAVLVVNQSLRQVALERGSLRPEDVTIVGNGPVLARTQVLKEQRAGEKCAERSGPWLCVWVGLMGPQDRLDLAIRAISVIVHILGRRDCRFVFIGDGEVRPEMERLSHSLSVDEYVTFTGWLDEPEVFDYLARADIGLEPNLEEFVSPVKVMEYMAFGIPVVAFDVRETRILAREAASYAIPGDADDFARRVVALLDNASHRDLMADFGRRRVQESVAWEHQEKKYTAVFRRLLRSRGLVLAEE